MKKKAFRRLSVVLVMVMLVSVMMGLPGITSAAGENPAFTLKRNKIYISIGSSITLSIKNVTTKDIREVKVTLADKKIAKTKVDKSKKKIIVTGKKVGSTKLTAILTLNRPINNKKQFRLTCKVDVSKPYIPTPTPTLEPFVLEPDDTLTPNVGITHPDSFTSVYVENGVPKNESAHFSIVGEEKNNGKMYVTIKNDGQRTGVLRGCKCHLIQDGGERIISDMVSETDRNVSPGSEYVMIFDVTGISFSSYRLELNGVLSIPRDVIIPGEITVEIKNLSPTNDKEGKVIEMLICNPNNFFVMAGLQVLVKKNGRIVDVIDGNQWYYYFNRNRDYGKCGLIEGFSSVKPNKNSQAYITYYPTKDFGDGLEFVLVKNSIRMGDSGVDASGKEVQGREERVMTTRESSDIDLSGEWSINPKDHIAYCKYVNNGKDSVYLDDVRVYFYKGDLLVDIASGIEVGNESDGIYPGGTVYESVYTKEEFDNIYVDEHVEKHGKAKDIRGVSFTSVKKKKNGVDGYLITITKTDPTITGVRPQVVLKNSKGEVMATLVVPGKLIDLSKNNTATCFVEHNKCYSFDSEGNSIVPNPFDLFGDDLPNYYVPDYSEVASQEILVFSIKR